MKIAYINDIQTVLESFYDPYKHITLKHNISSIRKRFTSENPATLHVQSIVLELKNYGLLESDSHVVLENRIFFITSKGLNILLNGGAKKYFDDLEKKEKLEFKLLQASTNSHLLNKIQLFITIILAFGTIVGLIFQYHSLKSQNEVNKLEILKLKYEVSKLI